MIRKIADGRMALAPGEVRAALPDTPHSHPSHSQQSRRQSRRRRQRLLRRRVSRCPNLLVRHTDRSCVLPCCGSPLSEIESSVDVVVEPTETGLDPCIVDDVLALLRVRD